MTARELLGAAALVPAIGLSGMAMPLLILAAAGPPPALDAGLCAGGGTSQTIAGVRLDPEQLGNAATIATVTARRHLAARAAVIAVDAADTETRLRNTIAETDHDSEGLFQQRISLYSKPIADDPVRATNAFLDQLTRIHGWLTMPVGAAAQAVQRSTYPQRYSPHTALAQQLIARLWPTAASSPVSGQPALCPGQDQTSDTRTAGGNVAGSTRIPPDLTITGSPRGRAAVEFALRQLGKPYVYGAAGPDAWDCSGLTMAAWATAGVPLPHWTVAQAKAGIPADLTDAVSGDLVFIPGSDGTPAAAGHVGMIAGRTSNGQLYLVQAPMTGIPVELTPISAWTGQIVAIRHLA